MTYSNLDLEQLKMLHASLEKTDKEVAVETLKRQQLMQNLKFEIDKLEGKSLPPLALSNSSIQIPDGLKEQIKKRDEKNKAKKAIVDILSEYGKIMKFGDLQGDVMERTGVLKIREFVRTLKRSNKIVLIKVNNSNKLAYWGKHEWIDWESKKLKNEHISDEIKPTDILEIIE